MSIATCVPETSYFGSPEFLLLTLHGATGISVPVHCFGLYCILFRTPEQMRSVKWYFVNLHIWIILYDYSVCFLTVPMLLLPSMSGYTLGLLSGLGVPHIFQTVLILLLLEYVMISILAIFENRFFTVCNFQWKIYWRKIRKFWLTFHYFLGIVILIPFLSLTPPDQNVARKMVFESLPCLPDYIYRAPVFVLADDYTYHMTAMVSFLVIGVFEALTFILLLVFNTIDQLRAREISQKLFEIQRKFFIALVIQMLVPLILLLIPLTYSCFSILLNYHNQGFMNVAVTMESIHGLVSTLVMIFIHRPYRDTFFDLFGKHLRSRRKDSNRISAVKMTPLRLDLNKL